MASSRWGKFKSSMKNFWRGNNVWKANKTKKNKTPFRNLTIRNAPSANFLYPKAKSKLNYNSANIDRIYGVSNDPVAVTNNNGKSMLVLNSDPSSLETNVNIKPKAILNLKPTINYYPREKGININADKYNRNKHKNTRGKYLRPYRISERNTTKPTVKETLLSGFRNTIANKYNLHNVGFRPRNNAEYMKYKSAILPNSYKPPSISTQKKKSPWKFWSRGGVWNLRKFLTRKSKPLTAIVPLERVVVHDPNARPEINDTEYVEYKWHNNYNNFKQRLPKRSKIPRGFESWAGENLGFVPGETRRRKSRSRNKNRSNNND